MNARFHPEQLPSRGPVSLPAGEADARARRPVTGMRALAIALFVVACIPAIGAGGLGGDAEPELYGAGLFSTGAWDFFMAFSPDGSQVLFCRADDEFSRFEILETRRTRAAAWSTPVRPRFAREASNADPHVTSDGRRVFFISNRPRPQDSARVERRAYDIWYADRERDGSWGEARYLAGPPNEGRATKWSPSVARNGNLYFGTARPGGKGGNDLWVSRLVEGRHLPAESLGDSINTPGSEIEPWIARDESYLIFSATAREDSIGGYDLYLSRRVGGVWQKARPLPRPINGDALDFNPTVSPDGRWLYFSSTRRRTGDVGRRFDVPRDESRIPGIGNGTGDIYRVRMRAVMRRPR
jgi:Tol biopolymer transport system component